MNLHRAFLLLLPAAMTLPLGCAKDSTSAAPEDNSSAQAAAVTTNAAPKPSVTATAAPKPARRAHPGLVGSLFHATGELTLKDDQKATIEKLEEQLKTDDAAPRTEFKALRADLVAGVKAGTIDQAKIKGDYAAIDKAVQTRQDAGAAALNGLYAALDPAQRKAVVAAVRTKQAEREAHEAKHDAEAKADPAEWQKKKLDHLTTELGLDAGQQAKVTPLLAKSTDATPATMEAHMADMKKHVDTVLTAFEGDGFDAKKLEQGPMPPAKVHERMEHEVQFLTQILPILKPDQREKLAANLEKPREMHRPGMPERMGEPGTWLHDPLESEGSAAPPPEPGGNQ
jgi:Spy/CpxP family protein refolding chaperone